MKIDGKEISRQILEDLKKRVAKLKAKNKTPNLYIITLKKNPETSSYIKQKLLKAQSIGAKITIKKLSPETSTAKLKSLIGKLNNERGINGIIVQRPLPKSIDEEKIASVIAAEKDVDGFSKHSKFSTPVALAVLKTIESAAKNQDIIDFLKLKKITVIGKGVTAGGPVIRLFKKLAVKIRVIDSKTKDRKKILKASNVIISATGKANAVSSGEIKKGVILVGVGLHLEKDGKFHGDFEEEKIAKIASYYTPTPGGIGPVNIAYLMKNLVEACEKQNF